MKNAQRIMLAARSAPAGLLKQACLDEGIDPRQVKSLSDEATDRLVLRLEAYGQRKAVSYSADDCGDGGDYVRGELGKQIR